MKTYYVRNRQEALNHIAENYGKPQLATFGPLLTGFVGEDYDIYNAEADCACGRSDALNLVNRKTDEIEVQYIVCEECMHNAPYKERLDV